MKRIILTAFLVVAAYFLQPYLENTTSPIVANESQKSDFQMQDTGEVIHVLPDDNKGSRHQRFILRLNNQKTLLIAHNIDLAPRIPNLKKGDLVEFYGEYEWNDKGGVVHWTHRDPRNKHPHGWLKHKGVKYE